MVALASTPSVNHLIRSLKVDLVKLDWLDLMYTRLYIQMRVGSHLPLQTSTYIGCKLRIHVHIGVTAHEVTGDTIRTGERCKRSTIA
jgi:hypothetical protein